MNKNKLVLVGYLSNYMAFLNISEEEALEKWKHLYYDGEPRIKVIYFTERFLCYDADEDEIDE